ncbi:MAG TPA: C4-type zinc ribbon domain-containing protein [Ignavibacteria bacterium]|nr:C4-type zinc ribbon domain-containing protein [Ignavibacteria bacterium]HMR40694.1 C4-type zinc ribbon domain-containing protein [Ignavibacteria bacterium]
MSENNNENTPEISKKETMMGDQSQDPSVKEEMKESDVENSGDGNTDDTLTEDPNDEEGGSRFQEYFIEKEEGIVPKMTEILLTFYDLKNIDEELTEIEDEKGDLPEIIDSLSEKIKIAEKELMEKNISTSKLEKEKAKLEEDDKSYEERINKYDEQKYDVRSNDEYDDVVKTIESLFEEVKKNETRIKEINGIHASLTKDIESLENKVKELTEDLNEKQTLLNELDEQYQQDESVLREKRIELLTKLDEKNKNLYERINNSYKGEATAIVRKGNCSGCYNSIPPQRVIEIKSAEKIYNCQSCGRILISDEMLAARDN